MTVINKEMKAADLASVTGGGWKTNLAIGGLCLASWDLLELWYALEPTMATWTLRDKRKDI